MRYAYEDSQYHFTFFFVSETGGYVSTGIPDDNGADTGIDPLLTTSYSL